MSKVFIEESTLTAIGNAIRAKEGSSALIAPLQMANKITNLPTGGGEDGVPNPIILKGDCSHRFDVSTGPDFIWILKNYGNRVQCQEITDASYMFRGVTAGALGFTVWPFNLNLRSAGTAAYNTGCSVENIFNSYKESTIPQLESGGITKFANFAQNASNLIEIPSTWTTSNDWSVYETYGDNNLSFAFSRCQRLRSYPREFFAHFTAAPSMTQVFYDCYGIDEFLNWPIPKTTNPITSNMFYQTFDGCSHAKNFTFDTTSGVPYVVTWSNQTLDLSKYFGYFKTASNATSNAGFTNDKRITLSDEYDTLKDDPDSWTTDSSFSRFNHDAAVRTINSLPDCSAGASNVVKFLGNSGHATPEGAINTLTEAEIAVAASKGWTVTLV